MGHSISKPEWHAQQAHHQVVVEPSSRPRTKGVRWFRSRQDGHEDDPYQTYNLPPQQTPRPKGYGSLFNRRQQNQPKLPVAQVIIHRPTTRYRTQDYRTRLTNHLHRSRSPSPTPLHIPIIKNPPTIGGRAFHPPKTLALMDVGSRLAERGKEARRGFREGLKAERDRRFNDACREYASLKVVTEQDVYNRMRKEQKREAKRQKMYTV